MTRTLLAALVVVLLAPVFASAQPPAERFKAVAGYRSDQSRTPLQELEAEIRATPAAALPAVEEQLIVLVQSPQATPDAKDWACRQLRLVGTEKAAPALVALLADPVLATPARWALESIPGEGVSAAVREAVGKLEGQGRVAAILTLGARGDAKAVDLLAPLASQSEPGVARAALAALGQIGGAEALAAIGSASVPDAVGLARLHATLHAADAALAQGAAAEAASAYRQLVGSEQPAIHDAALRGAVRAEGEKAADLVLAALQSDVPDRLAAAARLVAQPAGVPVRPAVFARWATLPAAAQVRLLHVVDDADLLPLAQAAVASKSAEICAAALAALGRLGDASCVPVLLDVASSADDAQRSVARQSLLALRGKEADAALISAVREGAIARRLEAIHALAARGTAVATPILLDLAREEDPAVRREALDALASVANCRSVAPLTRILLDASSDEIRSATERAIAAICRRAEETDCPATAILMALGQAKGPARVALVRLAARLPAADTLEALRKAVADSDPAVADAAVRGLAEWPDAAAAPDLVALAESASSPVHRVLALRGYVRLASLPGTAPEEMVQKLSQAMALATRPEEKKLVLAALAASAHPAALQLASASLSDEAVEIEAATAVVQIAKGLQRTDARAAGAAIRRVLEVCKTPAARQVAEGAQIVLENLVNVAPQGTASSPDDLEKDGAASGDQAAIDGDPATYWDEADGASLYRLVVSFAEPQPVSAISITGYEQHKYAPRAFEIVCDGKVVKRIDAAQYDDNFFVAAFDPVSCRTVELKITAYYGNSPAIRELGIYRAP